jgi:predicted 3-demethylubiquinone-9 3-methyltransferase (glyoxalase superfamily)
VAALVSQLVRVAERSGTLAEASRPTKEKIMQTISPFLWFDGQAEEAANFYVSIFKKSRIVGVSRFGEEGPRPAGSVMTVNFELDGEAITALNGGPEFSFSPAVSLCVNCDTQDEVDCLWEKLTEGGEPGQCGWLTDRYGLSWQVVPKALGELLQMEKIDIATLERAYAGEQETHRTAA